MNSGFATPVSYVEQGARGLDRSSWHWCQMQVVNTDFTLSETVSFQVLTRTPLMEDRQGICEGLPIFAVATTPAQITDALHLPLL